MNASRGRLTVIRALPVQTHVVHIIALASKDMLETALFATNTQVSFHYYFSSATLIVCPLSSSGPFIVRRRQPVSLWGKNSIIN